MKKLIPLGLLIIIALFASSCSPKLNATIFDPLPPLNEHTEVSVFTLAEPQPKDAKTIGLLEYTPRASFRCSNEQQLEMFKNEARKGGANGFKITESNAIDDNSCQETKGYFISIKDPKVYIGKDKYLHADEDVATIFLYRIRNLYKKRGNYIVLKNGEFLAELTEDFKQKIQLPEGDYTLSIKDVKNSEVQIQAKKGEVVYVKFHLNQPNFPALQQKDALTGRFEYESFLYSQNESYSKEIKQPSPVKTPQESEQNFFQETEPRVEQSSESVASNVGGSFTQEPTEPHGVDLRTSLSTGFGRRLGRLPSGLNNNERNYLNDLKSGFSIDAGLAIFFDEQNGIGLKINNFSTSAQANNLNFQFGNTSFSGPVDSQERMTFYGLTYNNRLLSSKNKNQLHTSIGIGFFEYVDNTSVGSRSFEIYHSTLGISSDISYDVMLSDRLFIGFQFSLFLGSASEAKLTLDNGTSQTIDFGDDAESFTRIDFSIGLRYTLF